MDFNSGFWLAVSNPSAAGASQLSLTGALLLLVAAGLLATVYQLHRVKQRLAILESRLTAARVEPASVTPPPGEPQSVDDPLSPEHVAAIVAACHAALGRPARVVSITSGAKLTRA
jgi:hypothetical protein